MNDKTKQFWEGAALLSANILLSLILFAAVIAILVFLTRKQLRKYKHIDMAVFEKLQTHVTQRRNHIMLFITFLGNHKFLIPANLFLIFYFLFIKYSWISIRVVAVALSSLVLMLLLKSLFKRKRPLAPLLRAVRGLSFPSGHAIISVTFYGLLIYIFFHTVKNNELNYLLTALLIILILLIGFSRVYLRVHYMSDVLAGFIIGVLWLFIALAVINRFENKIKRKIMPVFTIAGIEKMKRGTTVLSFFDLAV